MPSLEVAFTSQKVYVGMLKAARMASFLQRYRARVRWPVGVRAMTSSFLSDGKAEVAKYTETSDSSSAAYRSLWSFE